MKKMNLDKEVERTLTSLDHVQRVTLGGDFEKEVLQKVAFLSSRSTLRWLKYSAAAMILMALINGILLFNSYVTDEEQDLSTSMLYQAVDYTEFQ